MAKMTVSELQDRLNSLADCTCDTVKKLEKRLENLTECTMKGHKWDWSVNAHVYFRRSYVSRVCERCGARETKEFRTSRKVRKFIKKHKEPVKEEFGSLEWFLTFIMRVFIATIVLFGIGFGIYLFMR